MYNKINQSIKWFSYLYDKRGKLASPKSLQNRFVEYINDLPN